MKNQIKTLFVVFLIALFVGSSFLNIYGLEIPKAPTEDIYIQDYALMLSGEVKDEMLKMSNILKEVTSAELVVVTVPSMDGRPIEEYALDLFRQWGIGSEDKSNGVLLLVSRDDREARIEVGYGLEGAINDAKAGAFLDEMIAYFQMDNYSEGIVTAYSLLLREILVEYNIDSEEIFEGTQFMAPAGSQESDSITDIIKAIGFLLLVVIVIMSVLSRLTDTNLFLAAILLFRNLASGKYAGPTQGGPDYMGGRMGRGSMTGRGSSPFGGSSYRGGSSMGRGKFGGGSSGGGGASRKW